MFIDESSFHIKAGKGGDGSVSFRRERYVPNGGPDGGDGGNGGDVIFIGKHDLHTLSTFRAQKLYSAEDGANGMHKKMHGKEGDDLIIEVPLGTLVSIFKTNTDSDRPVISPPEQIDIVSDSQQFVAAKGGNGGWGNMHFATSIKQAPAWAKKGLPGQEFDIKLELKLIADVGLVGLPNAGKSTLLSVISNARPKIANYPFTTLEPQLGVVTADDDSFLMADIPGLIEGASSGKGLGVKFLKHIQRTKLILFLLDVSSPTIEVDLKTLQNELNAFDKSLSKKPNIVVFSKIDTVDQKVLDKLKKKFPEASFISAATNKNLHPLLFKIIKLLNN